MSTMSHSTYLKGYYQAINNLRTRFIREPKNIPKLPPQDDDTLLRKIVW